MTAFPKQTYHRSRELTKAIHALPCQNCGAHGAEQAHSNWSDLGGKGRGIKASDEYSAALCRNCHVAIDQGSRLTGDERRELWKKAWSKTIHALLKAGTWPGKLPVPDIRYFHKERG